MGNVDTVTANSFPKQGGNAGQPVRVLFHYGGPMLFGRIVREDTESPWRTIIALNDGRYVMSTECQYALEFGDT